MFHRLSTRQCTWTSRVTWWNSQLISTYLSSLTWVTSVVDLLTTISTLKAGRLWYHSSLLQEGGCFLLIKGCWVLLPQWMSSTSTIKRTKLLIKCFQQAALAIPAGETTYKLWPVSNPHTIAATPQRTSRNSKAGISPHISTTSHNKLSNNSQKHSCHRIPSQSQRQCKCLVNRGCRKPLRKATITICSARMCSRRRR